jgi:drug/metabolite transporter (DMT)-like permease
MGILLGFAGLVVIFWSDLVSGGPNVMAMCGIVISAVIQGLMLVIVKRYGKSVSSLALNLGGMMFGIVLLYAMAFTFEDYSRIRLDAEGVGSILYLGTFGTVIAFVVYYWLLKRVEAVYLSLISFITPIFAVVLGALILHERLSSHIFEGAALVLFGILITNGREVMRAMRQRMERTSH